MVLLCVKTTIRRISRPLTRHCVIMRMDAYFTITPYDEFMNALVCLANLFCAQDCELYIEVEDSVIYTVRYQLLEREVNIRRRVLLYTKFKLILRLSYFLPYSMHSRMVHLLCYYSDWDLDLGGGQSDST
jgi:hypothetical protein